MKRIFVFLLLFSSTICLGADSTYIWTKIGNKFKWTISSSVVGGGGTGDVSKADSNIVFVSPYANRLKADLSLAIPSLMTSQNSAFFYNDTLRNLLYAQPFQASLLNGFWTLNLLTSGSLSIVNSRLQLQGDQTNPPDGYIYGKKNGAKGWYRDSSISLIFLNNTWFGSNTWASGYTQTFYDGINLGIGGLQAGQYGKMYFWNYNDEQPIILESAGTDGATDPVRIRFPKLSEGIYWLPMQLAGVSGIWVNHGDDSLGVTAIGLDPGGNGILGKLALGTASNFIHRFAIGGTDSGTGFNIVRTDKNTVRNTYTEITDTSSYNFSFTPTGKPRLNIRGVDGELILSVDSSGHASGKAVSSIIRDSSAARLVYTCKVSDSVGSTPSVIGEVNKTGTTATWTSSEDGGFYLNFGASLASSADKVKVILGVIEPQSYVNISTFVNSVSFEQGSLAVEGSSIITSQAQGVVRKLVVQIWVNN